MKKKVIFINPSLDYEGEEVRSESKAYPFPGIMILGSVLDGAGYDVVILDANLYSSADFEKLLFSHLGDDVIYVGFSLMSMNVAWAYPYIHHIKQKHPEIKVVVGGFHPTIFPEQMIADDCVDVVAINESASIIEDLTRIMAQEGDLSEVNGIYYSINGTIYKNQPNTEIDNIRKIPFINLSLIEHEKYAKNNQIIFPYFPKKKEEYITYPVLTSFGCPYKCTFCINSILARRYRYRPAEEVVNRIEHLIKYYNANFIILQDEEFCINKKRFVEFVDLVEKRELDFHWRTSLRVSNFRDDYIDIELAKRLEKIGMVSAVMGGESGVQRVLDDIKKDITVEQIEHAMDILVQTNIVPKISFMAGIPGETDGEVEKTFRFCIKLKRKFIREGKVADIAILPFRLYPGSPLYERAVNELGIDNTVKPLKDFAETGKKEIQEGMGYEPTYKQYIKDPDRFERMVFLYDTFVWLNLHRKNPIRNLLEYLVMKRFDYGFYHMVFIEKMILSVAKAMRNIVRRARYYAGNYLLAWQK